MDRPSTPQKTPGHAATQPINDQQLPQHTPQHQVTPQPQTAVQHTPQPEPEPQRDSRSLSETTTTPSPQQRHHNDDSDDDNSSVASNATSMSAQLPERISSIIAEMEAMPNSMAVQRLGCWALGSLSNAETIRTVVDAGGVLYFHFLNW